MNTENESIYNAPKSDLGVITTQDPEELTQVLLIAKRQKALIYTFLIYFISVVLIVPLPVDIKPFAQLIVVPIWIAIIIFNARLCWLMYGKAIAVILIVLGIIPLINFLVVLSASSRANRKIKNAGFKVGFMGANIENILEARAGREPHNVVQ